MPVGPFPNLRDLDIRVQEVPHKYVAPTPSSTPSLGLRELGDPF